MTVVKCQLKQNKNKDRKRKRKKCETIERIKTITITITRITTEAASVNSFQRKLKKMTIPVQFYFS